MHSLIQSHSLTHSFPHSHRLEASSCDTMRYMLAFIEAPWRGAGYSRLATHSSIWDSRALSPGNKVPLVRSACKRRPVATKPPQIQAPSLSATWKPQRFHFSQRLLCITHNMPLAAREAHLDVLLDVVLTGCPAIVVVVESRLLGGPAAIAEGGRGCDLAVRDLPGLHAKGTAAVECWDTREVGQSQRSPQEVPV